MEVGILFFSEFPTAYHWGPFFFSISIPEAGTYLPRETGSTNWHQHDTRRPRPNEVRLPGRGRHAANHITRSIKYIQHLQLYCFGMEACREETSEEHRAKADGWGGNPLLDWSSVDFLVWMADGTWEGLEGGLTWNGGRPGGLSDLDSHPTS